MSNLASPSKEMRLAQYRASAISESAGENTYAGLRIHALPGLHAHVAELLAEHLPVGSSILELGAGSGALSLRMADMGYRVTSTDLVSENFRARDRVCFAEIDLDSEFSMNFPEPFDAVVAVEIIEHLENPMHVFRQVSRLLQPGGLFLVTTPNINNPVSSAMFCRFGHHLWFTERDRRFHGHISALSAGEMAACAAESGFDVRLMSSFGDPFHHVRQWWKLRLLARLIDGIGGLPKSLRGEILTALMLRRDASNNGKQANPVSK